jgi:hypothetical protein
VYDCGVGPRFLHATRFDSPNDDPWQEANVGALRQGRRFLLIFPAALLVSEWGNAMGVRAMRAKLFFVMAVALLWSASVFSENFSMLLRRPVR